MEMCVGHTSAHAESTVFKLFLRSDIWREEEAESLIQVSSSLYESKVPPYL